MPNRRNFLKTMGKAALVAPVVLFAGAPLAIVSATELEPEKRLLGSPTDVRPLTEGNPPKALVVATPERIKAIEIYPQSIDVTLKGIIPTWRVIRPDTPSMYDPLGMVGCIAIKYWIDGELHGDWIKVTDVPDDMWDQVVEVGQKELFRYSQEKIRTINPRYFLKEEYTYEPFV